MLGWISADAADAVAPLDRSREMMAEIERRIASRAIAFSTGPEVISGSGPLPPHPSRCGRQSTSLTWSAKALTMALARAVSWWSNRKPSWRPSAPLSIVMMLSQLMTQS